MSPVWWRRVRWAVVGVLVVVVGLVVGFKPAWDERPPDVAWEPGLVRLEGSCCARTTGWMFWAGSGSPWTHSVSNTEGADISVTVSMTDLTDEWTGVRDGRATFTYSISRWDADLSQSEMVQEIYDATGLSVGDTVTQGPVTIEVVAVYDFFFNRNNAVDLRVTFDESRLDEAP